MIHKFHPDKNRWDRVEPHIYKATPGVFREVTKQILFDNENEGNGHVLLGNQVYAVEEGDFLTIAPWQWHQLRADRGEILGFLCLVNHDRDIPKYPTEEDLAEIRKNPEAAAFLDGTLKD